ncbi:uncharacterized protein SPSC_02061 [Sporisorium scitamineum]|uniref:Mig1 protein n=1 Tax=Sporisorium scitamineum TaxID=49012 RepID=A0A127ZBU4_9BASI|nr:uncharacterized protein SPSC_02061 [Sporisorium scitamineum]
MWITKPFALVALIVVGAAVPIVAVDPRVTSETQDYDDKENTGKPPNPLFACTVRSARCKSASHFTGLSYYGNLQLSTCYQSNRVTRAILAVIGPSISINSFWAYCQDKDCGQYVKDNWLGKIASDMDQSVRDQTHCEPTFLCYDLKDVNDNCYPKE